MTVIGEVLSIINPLVRLIGIGGEDGLPLVTAELDILPTEAQIELPKGLPGDKGPDGEPGPPFDFQEFITDDASLDGFAANLGPRDVGKTWANEVSKNIYYWTGEGWLTLPGTLGVPGPPGPSNTLVIGTVSTLAAGSTATAEVLGSPPTQTLNLGIPRGATGSPGPPGSVGDINSATDYNAAAPRANGDFLAWDAASGKWKPKAPPAPPTVPPLPSFGTVYATNSYDTSTFNTSSTVTVCTCPVANPGYSYRVLAYAVFHILEGGGNKFNIQIKNSATSTVVGAASTDLSDPVVTAVPYSSVAIGEGSAHGVFSGDQTFLVTATRYSGSASFNVSAAAFAPSLYLVLVPA